MKRYVILTLIVFCAMLCVFSNFGCAAAQKLSEGNRNFGRSGGPAGCMKDLLVKRTPSVRPAPNGATTAIRPQIVDAATGKPVKGAVVVIAESNDRYTTDEGGNVPVVRVPFLDYGPIKSKFGQLTLVVYATGYHPSILVGCVTHLDRTRLGPVISVFPCNNETPRPFSLVETPPDEWQNQLVDTYSN